MDDKLSHKLSCDLRRFKGWIERILLKFLV